ncbi:MAG: hypothetical protein JKY32_10350 [Rhizobiales bacterium]|nr:hypothetical protein [Hyphomicrobiales bacterium]
MSHLNKTKSIPGPHHCVAIGKHARDWVFDALLKEVDTNNGSINRSQIETLRDAFEKSNGVLFEVATDTHNFCRASHNQKDLGTFDETVIFKFLIGEFFSDLLPKIFAPQHKFFQGKWKSICSAYAAEMIQKRVRTNVYSEYFDIYSNVSAIKGRIFVPADLTENRDIHILTKSVLEELKNVLASEENISRNIAAAFNSHILHKADMNHKLLPLIKVRQMTEFLLAVSQMKKGNEFRARVLEIG